MNVRLRGATSVAGLGMLALLLAACSPTTSSNTAGLNVVRPAQQLTPVQQSSVQQGTLPAIGATGTPAPGLSGTPVLGGQQAAPTMGGNTVGLSGGTGMGTMPTQTASAGGSFTTLGTPAATTGMGPEGTWTVTAGAQTCSINLPMTAQTGTNYYRASAPGCAVPQIAGVTGWQQVGSQLQLYDANGNIAAFLAPSGGRYIGTMGGGQAIAMSR